MSFNRNKQKLKEYKTRTVSVNGASWSAKDKQQREEYAKKEEEARLRQAKREEIAEAVPWIGEVFRQMEKENKL